MRKTCQLSLVRCCRQEGEGGEGGAEFMCGTLPREGQKKKGRCWSPRAKPAHASSFVASSNVKHRVYAADDSIQPQERACTQQ